VKYEEIVKTEKFQALLKEIPEGERQALEAAIRKMATDFEEKVLRPIESLLKK